MAKNSIKTIIKKGEGQGLEFKSKFTKDGHTIKILGDYRNDFVIIGKKCTCNSKGGLRK